MTIWDTALSQEEDATTRARIGRLRFMCQSYRLHAFLGNYEIAQYWLDEADKIAEKHRIAWGAWYE